MWSASGFNFRSSTFLIYINDIQFLSLIGTPFLFADDTTLLYTASSADQLILDMQLDLLLLKDWLSLNKLYLNVKKTVFMIFHKPAFNLLLTKQLNLGNLIIDRVNHVKFLGLILDQHLNWKNHISLLTKKLAPIIGILWRFKGILSFSCMRCLYYSLIHSHLNYMIIIWGHNNKTALQPIQVLQNRAIRNLLGAPYLTPIKTLYIKSEILPLNLIIKFNAANFIYNLIECNLHSNLFIEYHKNLHFHNTRQKDKIYTHHSQSVTYGT